MANDKDYTELGRVCGNVCQVLHRRLKGRRPDQLKQAVFDAIGDLNMYVSQPGNAQTGVARPERSTYRWPLFTGPWSRSRGRSSSTVNGTQLPGSFSRRAIKTELQLGSRTSSGSSTSSTYVRYIPVGIRPLSGPLLDRAGTRHPHDGCGYPSKRGTGGCFRSKQLGRYDFLPTNNTVLTVA